MSENQAVKFSDVHITSGFWKKRQEINRSTTVRTVRDRFAETGRFAAFDMNYRDGMENKPHIYWDSDVAKWIEGVAYLIQENPIPELETFVEQLIDKIEQHQGADGYFNIYFTAIEPSKRWTNRECHELYCAGHLIEAAVAWYQATGRKRFLDLMCKYADYIDKVFQVDQSASFGTPGHEEIELALIKLYNITHNERYLTLSRWFVDQRGISSKDDRSQQWKAHSHQDHLPCCEQHTAEGHAVRACYLYSAMADLAYIDHNQSLYDACEKLFDNIMNRRMYITGGIGSSHLNEAFTVDYDLPNQTAYAETCAAIALAFFAQRMLLLKSEAKYADVIERVLYNGIISGISLDGKHFFYTNPLEINLAKHTANVSAERGEWLPITERVEVFDCSCCPPNLIRFFASMSQMIYTTSPGTLYVHQYIPNHADLTIGKVELETEYPKNGSISIRVQKMKGKNVAVRIPGWCKSFETKKSFEQKDGYAYFLIENDDETISFDLRIKPMLVEANSNVTTNFGMVAVQRGPMIYCIEGIDNQNSVFDCFITKQTEEIKEESSEEYGVPILRIDGLRYNQNEQECLYRPAFAPLHKVRLTFIPYFAFANRGKSDMRVWVPFRDQF